MDGSVIGVGTDIGGSVRIPAGYCGIYSLKPTAGRISLAGAKGPVPGFEGLRVVAGPMTRFALTLSCNLLEIIIMPPDPSTIWRRCAD